MGWVGGGLEVEVGGLVDVHGHGLHHQQHVQKLRAVVEVGGYLVRLDFCVDDRVVAPRLRVGKLVGMGWFHMS